MSSTPPPHCSFCGKAAAEVGKIIAGPGIYICDQCVAACNDILAAGAGPSQPEIPEWGSMSDEEILRALPRIDAVGTQVELGLRRRVADLRARGVSWARIGAALGITRQSAWERFADEEKRSHAGAP
jgi:hypothetical protein